MRILVRKPNKVNNEHNTPAELWPLHSVIDCATWGEAWSTIGASPVGKHGAGVTEAGQLVYLKRST